jgi:hypothetical protein
MVEDCKLDGLIEVGDTGFLTQRSQRARRRGRGVRVRVTQHGRKLNVTAGSVDEKISKEG